MDVTCGQCRSKRQRSPLAPYIWDRACESLKKGYQTDRKKKLQRLHQYQVPGGSPVVAADLDSLKQEDLSSAFRSFCLIDHLIHP